MESILLTCILEKRLSFIFAIFTISNCESESLRPIISREKRRNWRQHKNKLNWERGVVWWWISLASVWRKITSHTGNYGRCWRGAGRMLQVGRIMCLSLISFCLIIYIFFFSVSHWDLYYIITNSILFLKGKMTTLIICFIHQQKLDFVITRFYYVSPSIVLFSLSPYPSLFSPSQKCRWKFHI